MGYVYLVGEQNPYGSDSYFALYPRPLGAAGDRLRRVLGLSEEEYLRRFERRNLLTGSKWSVPAARAAALAMLREDASRGDALVLLGARVAAAFLADFSPLHVEEWEGRTLLVAPHPSGRSRLWNDPGMARDVRASVLHLWVKRQNRGRVRRAARLDGDLE